MRDSEQEREKEREREGGKEKRGRKREGGRERRKRERGGREGRKKKGRERRKERREKMERVSSPLFLLLSYIQAMPPGSGSKPNISLLPTSVMRHIHNTKPNHQVHVRSIAAVYAYYVNCVPDECE